MVRSIILLYFFEKDHCSKSLFLGLNTKYSLKKNSVFQRNFVNFSNPKKDSIGIRQPGSIKWSINWVPTSILPASTNFRTHIHIIKNFLPNPFSDPSVARSLRSLWLSYFPNRGVRRIFKRGGRGVGAKRRLRGYCGRGSGAQPPENFNWIIC